MDQNNFLQVGLVVHQMACSAWEQKSFLDMGLPCGYVASGREQIACSASGQTACFDQNNFLQVGLVVAQMACSAWEQKSFLDMGLPCGYVASGIEQIACSAREQITCSTLVQNSFLHSSLAVSMSPNISITIREIC
jgi:uncharacterized UBP type Zn finger protein